MPAASLLGAFEVGPHCLGSPQLAHDCPRAVAMPVLVEGIAVGFEVANQNVLGANRNVLVAPRALVELARNAEREDDHVVVEVDPSQALLSTREIGLGHSGSLED